MNEEQELQRGLKNRHVQLISIGGAIGTGLFLGSGKSIQLAGPSILLAYLITGCICFFIMRALGELLLSNTNNHSFLDFVAEYLGKKSGFHHWLDVLVLLGIDCNGRFNSHRNVCTLLGAWCSSVAS